MTVAGSDSGGGAGIQADLKAFAALGVFGTSAVTCLTAQSPGGVTGVQGVPAAFVAEQMRVVLGAFPVAAVKTGMLWSADVVEAVAGALAGRGLPVVVDPVMIATSGSGLLRPEAMQPLRVSLLPLATVLTPNIDEAEALSGLRITDLAGLRDCARRIAGEFGVACVVKGGHLAGGAEVCDVLCCGGAVEEFRVERIAVRGTHGTGCTFSAVLAAWLARGRGLSESVGGAQAYVAESLRGAVSVGAHEALGWPAGRWAG